ncbi:hypothetical protein RGQ29_026395 [Quercus rubra]|uniref:PGG domain-containing protein n=1 Tax=Quercus rubra TaxID=3512 RepID=A0AAN7F0G6_QUERU|nr:hypothetical protein RGQ29_026395 [Quercus rubra]
MLVPWSACQGALEQLWLNKCSTIPLRMISEDKRNAFLVVSTLLITVTYEGVLNPPGGIWQEDSSRNGTHTHWSDAMKPNLSCFNENATRLQGLPLALGFFLFGCS